MKFQRGFILKFCAVIILSSLILAAIIYGLSASSTTTVFENSRLQLKSTADFILPLLVFGGLIVIVAAGAVTFIITLFVSHRIAGPVYRLEKDIAEVTKGNLNVTFRVRKNDEFQSLAEALNQMVKSLRDKKSKG
jgi:nitrogen fixation/metabolism regulation signal transduction histidine kinase